MIIDIHCHYTLSAAPAAAHQRFSFEPLETGGVHAFDACIAPRAAGRMSFWLMRKLLGLDRRLDIGPQLDQALARTYEPHINADGPIDRVVLLAFDAYHDSDGGRPDLPRSNADLGSDIYTSNSLIRELCRRSAGRCLFGASVHPYRENAVGCVEEVKGAGACLLKWIPLHQNIDIADPRTVAVLRRCAELGLPLLLHYSGEFTLATQHPEFQDVSALLQVLRRLRDEGSMPTVIVAHVATPVIYALGPRHDHELLVDAMLGEFADEPLYADISALTTIGKIRYLRRLARRQELHHKLLFGSDFPVPVSMCRLRGDLGDEFKRIASIESWPLRALAIFRYLGFNEIVFNRAATLLPNVHRFEPDELVAH